MEEDDDQDWRRLNLIYFYECVVAVVHIWAPFFRGPVSLCIHVPVVGHCDQQLVVVRVLVERGLASHMIQRHLLEGHGAKQES